MRNILLVHNDSHLRETLSVALRREIEGVVLEADSIGLALEILATEDISLLITGLYLPEKSGLRLLQEAKKIHSGMTTLLSIPAGDRSAINEVLQAGAFGYFNEPLDTEEAVIVAARAMAFCELQTHKEKRGPKFRKLESFNGIIGQSQSMQELFSLIDRIVQDDCSTVLVLGESGTGKELVARAIHVRSQRRDNNFVPVNCAAIPDELLESELFGYVKGAFTGAAKSKVGRIQYAHGGTLFLDEIGDMKPALQAKLLRVLQEREFEPVGGVQPVPADIRVIAATHQDLEKAVAEGRFREDLYYRLNVLPVTIPPLRERRDDIPLLIHRFTQYFNRNVRDEQFLGFDKPAMAALADYPWPGNVRELENLVQRMSILFRGSHARLADLPEKYSGHAGPANAAAERLTFGTDIAEVEQDGRIDFDAVISEVENRLIVHALTQAKGNKKEAAERLKMKRTTFLQKVKKKRIHFPHVLQSAAG